MANSTPIDPRRRGQQSAGGFTPIDLQRNWTNTQPRQTQPTPQPTTPSTTGASKGERNQNEGNLEDGPFAQSQPGYVGSDGRFAKFKTPEDGRRAQVALLRKNYGGKSIAQIVQKYAPLSRENSEASVRNYIGYVSSRTGLDPDAKFDDDHLEQVAAAMRAFETGKRGPLKFKPYGGQLAASKQMAVANGGGSTRVNLPGGVPGPSGAMNTGVNVQANRTMNGGPVLEGLQRQVEGDAVRQRDVLDQFMSQLVDTQQTRVAELNRQTATVAGINNTMTAATDQMIRKVAPVFQRRQEILDQALAIQDMSPIARAVRGFFDLNYDEHFLLNQADKLGKIVAQSEASYKVMQSLHTDAVQNADRLFAINTALPEADLKHLMERTKAQEMILQNSQENLQIAREGINNETLISSAQSRMRDDVLSQIDAPTAVSLLAQAEQNGGVTTFSGVTLSAQQLRETAQKIESYNDSFELQQMAVAAGRMTLADKQAGFMVQYANDSKLDQAIANGGVMDGVQMPAGLLSAEKNRRTELAIKDAQRKSLEATPEQAVNEAYASIDYERTLSAKMSTIFGPHTLDSESVAFSTQIMNISTAIKEATQRGASAAEVGVLRSQLAEARAGFNASVQEKVTRMVGGDKEGATYVQSYLMNDRPTPQAAASMLVHFATKGGLPSAVEAGAFGANAMKQATNLIKTLRTAKDPATGKAYTEEAAAAEAVRRLADSSTPDGKQFREVTAGTTFASRFSVLPRLANLNDQLTHPFGKLDIKAFHQAVKESDAYGVDRIAADNGFDTTKPDQVAQWQSILNGTAPAGMDPKKAADLIARRGELQKSIANEQARRLATLLDQQPRVSDDMTNSELMADFLSSDAGATAIQATAQQSSNGGFIDWMTDRIVQGGVPEKFAQYTQLYDSNLGRMLNQRNSQSLRLAEGYRNDPMRRFGAIAFGLGLNEGQVKKFAQAMAPLLPQGNAAETQRMRDAAALDPQVAAAIARNPLAPSGGYGARTNLAAHQINAIDTVITTHKFEDPEIEAIRKYLVSKKWTEQSKASDNFIDGLIGR